MAHTIVKQAEAEAGGYCRELDVLQSQKIPSSTTTAFLYCVNQNIYFIYLYLFFFKIFLYVFLCSRWGL